MKNKLYKRALRFLGYKASEELARDAKADIEKVRAAYGDREAEAYCSHLRECGVTI